MGESFVELGKSDNFLLDTLKTTFRIKNELKDGNNQGLFSQNQPAFFDSPKRLEDAYPSLSLVVCLISDMIGKNTDGTNFPHKLLLIDRQVSRFCKIFTYNYFANINLSKS